MTIIVTLLSLIISAAPITAGAETIQGMLVSVGGAQVEMSSGCTHERQYGCLVEVDSPEKGVVALWGPHELCQGVSAGQTGTISVEAEVASDCSLNLWPSWESVKMMTKVSFFRQGPLIIQGGLTVVGPFAVRRD